MISAQENNFPSAVRFLMLGVVASLTVDVVAKWLLADYTLDQFIFLRSIFGIFTFLSISHWFGGLKTLKTNRWNWHLSRTALSGIAIFCFFYGISQMPLVDVLTLAFVAPIIVTALSVPMLGEHVGIKRWIAVTIGFFGVIVTLRPGLGIFSFASVAVLISAVSYALLAITARKLSNTESTFSMSLYGMLGPLIISSLNVSKGFITPTVFDWFLFVLAGLGSAGAWLGITVAYSRTSPSILAPFEYTALIGAATAGYFIWDEIPDQWVIFGGMIIIGSGLYIVHRETGGITSSRYIRAITSPIASSINNRLSRKNKF